MKTHYWGKWKEKKNLISAYYFFFFFAFGIATVWYNEEQGVATLSPLEMVIFSVKKNDKAQ